MSGDEFERFREYIREFKRVEEEDGELVTEEEDESPISVVEPSFEEPEDELERFKESMERLERREEVKRLALLGKPEMMEYGIPPSGQTIVAQALAPQLGSDIVVLREGKVDMRRFSIISEKEARAISYFFIRGYVHKVRFWRHYVENFLNLAVSVGGVGRKQLIEMQRATQSLGGGREEEEQLSWIERHITKRGKAKED